MVGSYLIGIDATPAASIDHTPPVAPRCVEYKNGPDAVHRFVIPLA
jgi:hypothetical protein